jgi:hypothetical protein
MLCAIGGGCARDLSFGGRRPLLVELVVLLALEAAKCSSEHNREGKGVGAYRYSRMRPKHLSKYSSRPAMVSSRISSEGEPSTCLGRS